MEEIKVEIRTTAKARCEAAYTNVDSVCRMALRQNPEATCLNCPFEECMFVSHHYESEELE